MNKWLRRAIIVWQYIYETRIAPFFSRYLWLVWWPAYLWLRENNYCFVINIAEGTGQVLPELDNFLLGLHLGEIDTGKRYIWLRTRNDFSQALVPLYKHYFAYARMSNVLYDLCLPIMLRWRDITHDAGMAGLHWQLPPDDVIGSTKRWSTHLYMMPKEEPVTRWREYYRRRRDGGDYAPLLIKNRQPDDQLLKYLGGSTDKTVLLHIKTNIMNATARPTDPKTYIPAIKHLQKIGYRLVLVGREQMPEVFKAHNILNYAQSSIASFAHDLQLFSVADFSITGGSGIAWIADCLRQPILYLNSWHLFMPPAGEQCIFAPALVRDKKTGHKLSFKEQYALYLNTSTEQGDQFPFKLYEPVNASADDIMSALLELEYLLDHGAVLSDGQKKFQSLVSESWMQFTQSRISDSFVKKYADQLT